MTDQTPLPDQPVWSERNLTHALEAALVERDAIAQRVQGLESELADLRARPLRGIADLLVFRLLRTLSTLSPPLPRRTATRFARSALKRDPRRTLRSREDEAENAAPASERGGFALPGSLSRDPLKQDILVVSHSAGRTGAPILALNLVEHLNQRFNVTTLLVRGGECTSDFAAASVGVFVGEGLPRDNLDSAVQKICAETRFAFAIVNSAESHGVLSGLNRARVPTLSLLHEFAPLIRPVKVLDRLLRQSDHLVFSAAVTRESARQVHPGLESASLHVIPQGKCRVPTGGASPAARSLEQGMLKNLLRPDGTDDFVVLGAGTVGLRKGVDLFVETARRVLSSPGGERFRFVWIGGGYDPKGDDSFSMFLRDQLIRAKVADRVVMGHETAEIETAYALSDVLLVPSRLDPLPNVGIDAITAGLPVICFDRATGLAEQLEAAGVRAQCVADYIDCSDMAAKLLALAASAPLRAEVSSQLRAHARTRLDFSTYAREIAELGLLANAQKASAG